MIKSIVQYIPPRKNYEALESTSILSFSDRTTYLDWAFVGPQYGACGTVLYGNEKLIVAAKLSLRLVFLN